MTEWEVRIDETPSREGTWAEIAAGDQRKVALIYLSESFDTQSAYEQKHTLVHELLHCYLKPIEMAVDDMMPELSPSAQRIAQKSFSRHTELMIDQLARVISGTMPDPEWPPTPASVKPSGGIKRARRKS